MHAGEWNVKGLRRVRKHDNEGRVTEAWRQLLPSQTVAQVIDRETRDNTQSDDGITAAERRKRRSLTGQPLTSAPIHSGPTFDPQRNTPPPSDCEKILFNG